MWFLLFFFLNRMFRRCFFYLGWRIIELFWIIISRLFNQLWKPRLQWRTYGLLLWICYWQWYLNWISLSLCRLLIIVQNEWRTFQNFKLYWCSYRKLQCFIRSFDTLTCINCCWCLNLVILLNRCFQFMRFKLRSRSIISRLLS